MWLIAPPLYARTYQNDHYDVDVNEHDSGSLFFPADKTKRWSYVDILISHDSRLRTTPMTENCGLQTLEKRRADALRDDCSCQLVAHSPASHSGGGQVERKPTGIASSPSNADASRTAWTNAMSILRWLAHRSEYGEYALVNKR